MQKLSHLKLGKKPARHDAVKFKFANYFNVASLPMPNGAFGHQSLVKNWGMLGNDRFGDCVWAGAAHEEMMESLEGGHGAVAFDDASVLSDYSAVTGFNPNDENSDQGTDMELAAKYRRQTGIVDIHGNRHKVDAYVAIQPGNVTELVTASYLFSAVGIGIQFPGYAMDQFDHGQPWHLPAGWRSAEIDGGHYIPVIGRDKNGYLLVVTWGKLQRMSNAFFKAYCDEAIVYINLETLNDKGLTPENLNRSQLEADLASLKKDPNIQVADSSTTQAVESTTQAGLVA